MPGNAFFYLIIARERRQRILLNAAQQYNVAIARLLYAATPELRGQLPPLAFAYGARGGSHVPFATITISYASF